MQKLIRIVVGILIVVGIGWAGVKFMGNTSGLVPSGSDEASKGYSAVFLSNDQVYFGKVSATGGVVVLKDVYYIRLNEAQPQQPGEEQQQPQLTLVKLGDQIHGPVDEMRINQDQVLFVERLKDESTVVKAIAQDKESRAAKTDETPLSTDNSATPSTPTTTPTTPSTNTDSTNQ